MHGHDAASGRIGGGRYLGESVLRTEDHRLLTGRGLFVDDVELPDTLHVAFVRSPWGHAAIGAIDSREAAALPGVEGVFTGRDLADAVAPLVPDPGVPELRRVERRALPIDRARFTGEAVVAVVASSRYVAEDAAELVVIEWEPLPPLASVEAATSAGAPELHVGVARNTVARLDHHSGDVEAAFAAADLVVSKRFTGNRVTPAPIETRGVGASFDAGARELTVRSSTQVPQGLRATLAGALGLPQGSVRVIAPDVGGGFGGKGMISVEELVVAALACRLGRTVKWIEDRAENLLASTHAKELVVELDAALSSEGRLQGLRARFVGDAGAYSIYPHSALVDAITAAPILPSVYDVRDVGYELEAVLTNKCPAGAYRGVGRTNTLMALESLLDDAARRLGIDPVELRLKNVIGDEPYVSATGMRYDGGSYAASIDKACEAVDYPGFRARQRDSRSQGRHLGIGICPYIEPTGWGTAMSEASRLPMSAYDSVTVSMDPDGSVTVRTGFQSHGQSHETTFAQVAADHLGVPLESVRVLQGDTALGDLGMGTFASRSAVIGGGAIAAAAGELRGRLLAIAAETLEASPEDLAIGDGVIGVAGSPQARMTVAEASAIAYFGGAARPDGLEPGLTAARTYDPPETYANGTIVAIVEVDLETGVVRVESITAVDDCGTMVNPLVVAGQVMGGAAQGIGIALYERMIYDEDAQVPTGTLMDYPLPSTLEIPELRVLHLCTPSPLTSGGIKGVGEAGTQATPAAVVNAVADALAPFGVAVERTPLDPETVLALLDGARPSG